MDFLRQLIAGVREAWQRLALSARVNIGLAAVATLVLLGLVIIYGSRPQYVTLYSQLSGEDSATVLGYLQEQSIPYELQQGGATVLVPVQNVGEVRLNLAMRGVPKSQGSSVGWEIFDQQNLAPSEALQNVNKRRAIQGEAQRQLNQLEFVNSSFVTITEAEDSLFLDEQRPSKAAVTLDVSRRPSDTEIIGILNIVCSHGGANLSPSNVTLVTTKGELLHEPPETEFAALANSKFEMIRQYERERERSVEEALRRLGVKSVARVSAKLDFDTLKETSRTSTAGAPVSTYSVEQSTTSTQTPPEGAAGASANLPGAPETQTGNQTAETVTESIENNEVSTKTTERTVTPGNIVGYRVAVMVSGKYEVPEGAAADAEPQYVPRSDEEISSYEALVAAAVGVDQEVDPAEDVTVSDVPMPDEAMLGGATQAVAGIPLVPADLLNYVGMLVQGLLVLALFFFSRRVLLRLGRSQTEEEEAAEAFKPATLSPDELRNREMMNDIQKAFAQEPDNVANVIRTWMKESE